MSVQPRSRAIKGRTINREMGSQKIPRTATFTQSVGDKSVEEVSILKYIFFSIILLSEDQNVDILLRKIIRFEIYMSSKTIIIIFQTNRV